MGNGATTGLTSTWKSVHPHAYGERSGNALRGQIRDGSSPRIWGTVPPSGRETLWKRFIPTHMGNGRRGSNYATLDCGSSPRIWGTAPSTPPKLPPGRFIPTHMGNGPSPIPLCLLSPVHPHAYGERVRGGPGVIENSGSSPRIWGTACPPRAATGRTRFIPTHMGNGVS